MRGRGAVGVSGAGVRPPGSAYEAVKDSLEGAPQILPADGVVLAGGAGRRMGGCDKGLLVLAGRPLAAHVAAVLAPHCGRVWIAARSGAAYRAHGFAVLEDGPWAGAGPLAGIRAALLASRAPAVLIAPCDAPFLPAELAPRLRAALHRAPAVYAHDGARAHYACAALRTALAGAVEDFLAAGGRALHALYARIGAQGVDFSDCPAAFRNLNTPAELAAAARTLATA